MAGTVSKGRSAASVAEAPPCELRVDVSDILEELAESIHYVGELSLDTLVIGTEEFRPQAAARLDCTLTFAGTAIVAEGTVEVEVSAVCSRCLAEFSLPVRAALEGFYVERGAETGVPDEQEVEYVSERSIDLLPAVHTALLLELPFAPLHDPDCPGICATCGKDLAEGPCSCEPSPTTSPFADLKELFDREA